MDDLRDNILDIWAKFPVSLCNKLCSKFNNKINYVKEFKGKRINKEIIQKIHNERKEENGQNIEDDNEWISVKRDYKFRIVYNNQIVKKIKSKFENQIKKQKNERLKFFKQENPKLKRNEKKKRNIKMTKKQYNSNIDYKKKIITNFYDEKIKEINQMTLEDFIVKYLNKENKENIKILMNANLSNNFTLTEANTDISNQVDNLIAKDDLDIEVEKKIEEIIARGRRNKVKKYINFDINIDNHFPYEPKKFKKEKNNRELNKIDEIDDSNKEIYDILKDLTDLNEKIKEYEKKNKEKTAKISVEMADDEDEAEDNFMELE